MKRRRRQCPSAKNISFSLFHYEKRIRCADDVAEVEDDDRVRV